MRKNRFLIIILGLLVFMTACSAAQPDQTGVTAATTAMEQAAMADETMAESEPTMGEQSVSGSAESMDSDPAEATAEAENSAPAERPAWQQLPLTNARSGETFTLADLAGKTIFVEPMATWCSNCRRQLGNVREAQAQLGDDVVFIGLSVETNLDQASLAQYADAAGFEWTFAVLTPEMLQALVDQFGRAIANPPATPHFIVRADGSFSELVTGIDPPEQIVAQIQAAG